MNNNVYRIATWSALSIVIALLLATPKAFGGGKVGIYGVRMVPYGTDAEAYSNAGWGGGLHAVVPVEELSNVFAGTAGIEIINLLSETESFQDRLTGLRVDQETDQNYFRLYLGTQIGGHGNAFFRPHAGVNIALVYYYIRTDVVVPDDYNRENEIRQKLRGEGNVAFGYDLSAGLDLNFSNFIAIDGGVKYLKSFSIPQQFGDGSVRIHPQYFQIYLGVGVSFEYIKGHSSGSHD